MKYSIILCLLGTVIIQGVFSETAPSDENASVKSAVPNQETEKQKVDSETKEQLQESDNDDKDFEKQKQEKEGSGELADDDNEDADSSVENVDENSKQGPEESSTESKAEDTSETEDESVRRTEEGKAGKSDKKKGRKLLAIPLYYPGDYFAPHHYLGGPAQFNPAGFWQYPYPYVHPMYPNHFNPCHCECNEDKDDKDDDKEKSKKNRRKQLVPSHYYGPPSAGWGGFQPGHTGAGWGAPYWYKSHIPSPADQASRRFGIETAYQTLRPVGTYAHHYVDNDIGLGHGGYGYLGGHGAVNFEGDHVGYDWNDDYGYGSGGHGYGQATGGPYGYSAQDYGMDHSGITHGWGSPIGRPYIPKHGHGHGHAHGHHSYPDHNGGQNHIDIHHGHAYFSHELAYQHLPTAQGHIQIASSGHDIGMGGHNLGGIADKQEPGHGSEGDFVGGIHADLGIHGHHGHGHGHHYDYHGPHHVLDDAHADLHVAHPSFRSHGDDDDNLDLHGEMGDHFGSFFTGRGHGHGHAGVLHTGMPDHFGPLLEHSDDSDDDHAYGGGHVLNERIASDFEAHAGHGGAFDGHMGNSVYGHLIGGHHKSGVPLEHKKEAKKLKSKAKTRAFRGKQKAHSKQEQLP